VRRRVVIHCARNAKEKPVQKADCRQALGLPGGRVRKEKSMLVDLTQLYDSSEADMVISAFKRRDTGQFAFADAAAVSKASRVAPGMRAFTSK